MVILWPNELGHAHLVYGGDCASHAGGDLLARLVQAAEAWRKLLSSLTAVLQIHVPTWALLVSLVGFVRRCPRGGGPWLALLCGLFALDAYAAKPSFRGDPTYLIDTWETEDGLPENSATAMVQTPDGYLWFGTFNGLVRFDGVKFTVFKPDNTPELPTAGVVNLHVDQRGWLWVSTLRGMVVLADNKWRSFGVSEGWAGNRKSPLKNRPPCSRGTVFLPVAIHSHLQVANVQPRPQATAWESCERSQKSQISSDSNDSRHACGAPRPREVFSRLHLPATSFPAVLQFWETGMLYWSY